MSRRLALLADLAAPACAEEARDWDAWNFREGQALTYDITFRNGYSFTGLGPAIDGKDVYVNEISARVTLTVRSVDEQGAAELAVAFVSLVVKLGSEDGGKPDVFDSAKPDPEAWAAALLKEGPTLRVDRAGRVLASAGFDANKRHESLRRLVLGDRLMGGPALPPPDRFPDARTTPVPLLHDTSHKDSRLSRSRIFHEVPMSWIAPERDEAGFDASASVPDGTKVDVGSSTREPVVPGVSFEGIGIARWADGAWESVKWQTRGSAEFTLERKPTTMVMEAAYEAKRVR